MSTEFQPGEHEKVLETKAGDGYTNVNVLMPQNWTLRNG